MFEKNGVQFPNLNTALFFSIYNIYKTIKKNKQ